MVILTRIRRRLPIAAFGALSAQVVLALGGFVLQVLAARELGARGLGTFALLYGAIVMATALTTGLLGDSLTVLDRQDLAVRRALFRLAVVVVLGLAVVGTGVATTVAAMDTALLFGVAIIGYVTADLFRRLTMAGLRFWNLVLADFLGLVAMVTFLGGFLVFGSLSLNHFLAALIISQLVATVVMLIRLPREDLAVHRGTGWGNVAAVLGYGAWRGMQQFVRPTMLNGARWLVLIAAGSAAVGQLEAGRIFVAPAMLLVQGLGSYLFSSYAGRRADGTARLLSLADRVAAITIIGSVLIAGIAWAVLPIVGDLITGGRFSLDLIAVLGWGCYAASCATVLPYGSLAAVQGRQQWVFLIRVLDSLVSLGLAAALVVGFGVSPSWTPWLLSIGSFVGGVLCRQVLLRRRAVAEMAMS